MLLAAAGEAGRIAGREKPVKLVLRSLDPGSALVRAAFSER